MKPHQSAQRADQRGADAIGLEQIADLVSLDRVVEGVDLVAEFLGHIHDLRHFVGAVAVVLDADIAVEHARQRFHAEIAGLQLARIALAPIFLRLDPLSAQ